MCELTLCNTHRSDLNRLECLHQVLENTRKDNKDGWGIFTVGSGIYKTSVIPWKTESLGLAIKKIVTEQPVLLHVRSASVGTAVKVEFNHPFESDRLVLAHNGTLKPKRELTGYEGKLDSEVFLLELDRVYSTETAGEEQFIKALKETMNNFTGKFAFIIYDKVTTIWYAVRGKTADLHISYILDPKNSNAVTGYVINTARDDLGSSLDISIELMNLLNRPKIPLWSEIEPLKEETIYRLDEGSVVVVGEIKQNIPVYVPVASFPGVSPERMGVWSGRNLGRYRNACWGDMYVEDEDEEEDVLGIVRELSDWIVIYGISWEELDVIMLKTLGVPILSCTPEDIGVLRKHVLPKIQCQRGFRTHMVKKLKTHGHVWIRDVYAKGKFQFPYMLEPRKKEFLNAVGQKLQSLSKV